VSCLTNAAQCSHPPPRQAQHQDSISSVAALRLTCHAIKDAVDHALGAGAQGSALYAPLDQFLANHFFPPATAAAASVPAGSDEAPPLPLLSDSAEAARTKEQFRKMADLTLGVAQARLHQSRYVCPPPALGLGRHTADVTILVVRVRWCV
jgi:hypothetical protein